MAEYDEDMIQALASYISAGETEIVNGLSFQDQARELGGIITNLHEDPKAGPFVIIDVRTVDDLEASAGTNSYSSSIKIDYSVEMFLVDYARVQQLDSRPYQISNSQFRTMVGRIRTLIRRIEWLEGEHDKYRRPREKDRRRIRTTYNSGMFKQGESIFAGLSAKIEFILVNY